MKNRAKKIDSVDIAIVKVATLGLGDDGLIEGVGQHLELFEQNLVAVSKVQCDHNGILFLYQVHA